MQQAYAYTIFGFPNGNFSQVTRPSKVSFFTYKAFDGVLFYCLHQDHKKNKHTNHRSSINVKTAREIPLSVAQKRKL